MAAGRGGGGASPVGFQPPRRWLVPAPPLLIQGELCRSLMPPCLVCGNARLLLGRKEKLEGRLQEMPETEIQQVEMILCRQIIGAHC